MIIDKNIITKKLLQCYEGYGTLEYERERRTNIAKIVFQNRKNIAIMNMVIDVAMDIFLNCESKRKRTEYAVYSYFIRIILRNKTFSSEFKRNFLITSIRRGIINPVVFICYYYYSKEVLVDIINKYIIGTPLAKHLPQVGEIATFLSKEFGINGTSSWRKFLR